MKRVHQLLVALFLIVNIHINLVVSFQRFGWKIKTTRFSEQSPSLRRQPPWRSAALLKDSALPDVKIISKGDVHRIETTVAGKVISFETGKIGRQASGAVVGQVGDTIVYSTACYEREAVALDFTPLKVDYFARFSAVGQTIGAFHRRDSRGDDSEILVARLIDRPIRPVLLDGWQHDTQILAWVLSYDKIHSSEVLAINCASAALAISDIPISSPIAGVEVGLIDGQFIVNPTKEEMKRSELVLTLAGSRNGILMIEGVSRFVTEEQMMEALTVGHAAIVQICHAIDVFQSVAGKAKKLDTLHSLPHSLTQEMDRLFGQRVRHALSIHDKHERGREVGLIEEEILKAFTTSPPPPPSSSEPLSPTTSISSLPALENLTSEDSVTEDEPVSLDEDDVTVLSEQSDEGPSSAIGENTSEEDEASELAGVVKAKPRAGAKGKAGIYDAVDVKIAVKKLLKQHLRDLVLTTGRRSDGRTVEDVRPISIETNWLPGAHGSTLFTRGETQTIATATLGTRGMEAKVESLDNVGTKRFYLQYRFPPSSVGETGRVGMLTRREVGHGNLAERALTPVIPESSVFPYSMRAESLITESSGSSSMATVCGCCLAMLDAGVPLTSMIAGVAMGMILGERPDDSPVILTDILGLEDALGTMDLKVAGNETGITAFQLDIKTEGLTLPILSSALAQAKRGRMHILRVMREALSQPRELKPHIPRVLEMRVPVDVIGKIIGPKGRKIQGLIEQYQLEALDVEDDGFLQLSSTSMERNEAAREAIMKIVEEDQSRGERGGGGGSGGSGGEVKEVEVEVGTIYRGCAITGVQPFGLFVELLPGVEGLIHISEIDVKRVASIDSAGFSLGQKVDVKLLGKSDAGKLRLSRRAVLLRDSGREESADPLEKLKIKVAVKSRG